MTCERSTTVAPLFRFDPTLQVAPLGSGIMTVKVSFDQPTMSTGVLCPDLLSIEDLGEADGWRGGLVRAFFRVLSWLT